MSNSLNSLKGGAALGVSKGDARSLDYGSCSYMVSIRAIQVSYKGTPLGPTLFSIYLHGAFGTQNGLRLNVPKPLNQ